MNTRLTESQRLAMAMTRVYDFDTRATPISGKPIEAPFPMEVSA